MIPALGHFIWFGRSFPWVNELAVRSALVRGRLERVILHHDGAIPEAALDRLRALDGFEARLVDPGASFAAAEAPELGRVYAALERPNARANVLRAVLLLAEGGVYLDMDTVTVRPLEPLLSDGAFCGEERVVWPAWVKRSRRPDVLVRALVQDGLRFGCAMSPRGWRLFRRVEGWYPTAVNNAVLGAAPGHPFVRALVDAMIRLPEARRRVPYALGTHLLQTEVATWADPDAPVRVHPPEVFYPLGPVLSRHWFGEAEGVFLDEVVGPSTRVVHWYASVRTRAVVPSIGPEHVRARADRELFSALARPFV